MAPLLLDTPLVLRAQDCHVGEPSLKPRVADNAWAPGRRDVASIDTAAFRLQAAQQCLDTVAVLRTYREPLEGEVWTLPGGAERRLLAQVNAIVGLGEPALRQTAALALDGDVPDPGRVFAALFVLGCVEGRRWLPAMREIFIVAVDRHAAEAAAAVEALSLAPNPLIDELLAPLLGAAPQRRWSAALRVLAYRGSLTAPAWQAAMGEADPAVQAAAVGAPLGAYDIELCNRALYPAYRHDNPAIAGLALRAGLSRRLAAAHDAAVAYVTEAKPGPLCATAAHGLAMFGLLEDARHVRRLIEVHWLAGARAAATLGATGLVPDLLALLERQAEAGDRGNEVRAALWRITGLPFGACESVPEAHRLWAQHADAFHPRLRFRFGRPLDGACLLQALDAPTAEASPRGLRQDAYLELQSSSAVPLPRFSAYDFVAVQHGDLQRLRRALAEVPAHAGMACLLH